MSARGVQDSVAAIRTRIAAIQLVACRMAHERVCEVSEGVVRQPLCSKETRARRLACGHTMARDHLARDLATLQTAGMLSAGDAESLGLELAAIGHTIQLLDHRKGDAEKRLALLKEAHQPSEAAATEVRALEREHDGYVERLRTWRNHLSQAIDEAASRPTEAEGGADAS